MSIRELTCIGCPMGCQLTAVMDGSRVTEVTGNTCPRGDAYARKECTHPARTVTGTVRVSGGALPVVSVRTAGEVPKEKVLDVARALCRVQLTAPVQAGDVVIPNVLGTGVDVVATGPCNRIGKEHPQGPADALFSPVQGLPLGGNAPGKITG